MIVGNAWILDDVAPGSVVTLPEPVIRSGREALEEYSRLFGSQA